MRSLHQLNFDNSYARLPADFYSQVRPDPLLSMHLAGFSPEVAELIELDPAAAEQRDFVDYLGGAKLLPGMEPLAAVYAGHQFGYYVPQLGDGRAILLGEVRNSQGQRWDLQLKGAGLTPYSRQGDGRAVLRSTIREYLCSEAMAGLGIPTTRALCFFGSESAVYRERVEPGAMLLRLSPSHVRFGSFELFYYRNQYDHLSVLADYVIADFYPQLQHESEPYLALFTEVVRRTARLMAQWQAVGFAHGVMNTDNMSILGLTLDYGPFGFLDAFQPGFICNHSDHAGRYAFDQQPQVALWNLVCLAQALSPLMDVEAARQALAGYHGEYASRFLALMAAKLGLQRVNEQTHELVQALLQLLQQNQVDYTRFFRALGNFRQGENEANPVIRDQFIDREGFGRWATQYRRILREEQSVDERRKQAMDRVNPKYILRNYLAQQAIEMAEIHGDYNEVETLRQLLCRPFDEQSDYEAYADVPPDWAGSISVSCSS